MAQTHTFFQYLRLKCIVVLLRAFVWFTSGSKLCRDKALISPNIEIKQIKIPSRDRGRHIRACVYYPPSSSTASSPAPSSKRPVLINYHGSGFIELLGTDALFCFRMARDAGAVVIDADYRKSPENPFPAALHDVEDTLRWVAAQSDSLDQTRVGLSGFSAGGTLALAAATVVRETLGDILDIRIVLAAYPLTDMAADPASKKVPHPINPHPTWALRLFNDCYAPDVQSRADPAISPGFATPAQFPPTVALLTCSGDLLSPEADTLAKKIESSGMSVEVVNHVLEGVPHAFDKGAEEGTSAWVRREEAYRLMAELLKETFSVL